MTHLTLRTSDEIHFNLWWREYNLQLTKFLLERYKETGDEFYYGWAKTFGEWSRLIKENYL